MFYIRFDRVLLLELIIGQFSPAKKDWLTERSEYLSSVRDHPLTTDGDRENIDAVLEAYKDGSLQRPTPGKIVIYFGGIRRTGEVEMGTFEWEQVLEWRRELGGKGRQYVEGV
jgi:hypothetical protein